VRGRSDRKQPDQLSEPAKFLIQFGQPAGDGGRYPSNQRRTIDVGAYTDI